MMLSAPLLATAITAGKHLAWEVVSTSMCWPLAWLDFFLFKLNCKQLGGKNDLENNPNALKAIVSCTKSPIEFQKLVQDVEAQIASKHALTVYLKIRDRLLLHLIISSVPCLQREREWLRAAEESNINHFEWLIQSALQTQSIYMDKNCKMMNRKLRGTRESVDAFKGSCCTSRSALA